MEKPTGFGIPGKCCAILRYIVTRNGNVCKVKEAIKQRLMYSFGFTYEQELDYLFATANVLYLAEYYTLKVRRVGATKVLNRSDKKRFTNTL